MLLKKLYFKSIHIFARNFPGAFAALVRRGILNEPRWVNLQLRMDGDDSNYLKDDHRNREWYCDFLEAHQSIKVLEIGAGGMHDVRLLKERGSFERIDYTIMDVSNQVLAEGKRIFPELKFKKGSINNIPFPDNYFDIVYCRHVIEHQPEFQTPVREMLRVSRGVTLINLFRWTLNDTWINRVKKFSNSYNIQDLLAFMRAETAWFEYFILLKGDKPGVNVYDDPAIIRADDHMLLVLGKKEGESHKAFASSLEKYRRHVIDKPYDNDPPTYNPQPKQHGAYEAE